MVWYEFRYCDSPMPPLQTDDVRICRNCGAEWDPILIEEPEEDGEA